MSQTQGAGRGEAGAATLGGNAVPSDDHGAETDPGSRSRAVGGCAGGRSGVSAAGLRRDLAADAGTAKDYELMRKRGSRAFASRCMGRRRAGEPRLQRTAVGGFDHEVRLAAREGMEILPFIVNSPGWVAARGDRPAGRQRLAAAGLGLVRSRGGRALRRLRAPSGGKKKTCPTRRSGGWEIWNEQNIVSFARPRTEAVRDADPDRRPGNPPRAAGREGDRRRSLRPAAADPAQRRLRRLPRPHVQGGAGEAIFRRGRAAPLRRRRAGDGRAAAQPAPDHAQ